MNSPAVFMLTYSRPLTSSCRNTHRVLHTLTPLTLHHTHTYTHSVVHTPTHAVTHTHTHTGREDTHTHTHTRADRAVDTHTQPCNLYAEWVVLEKEHHRDTNRSVK